MGSVIVDVAKRIKTDLDLDPVTNFGISFTAVLSFADFDEALSGGDFDSVRCDVVPINYSQDRQELENRLAIENEVSTHVVLRKKLTRTSTGELTFNDVAELITALELIRDFFVMRTLTSTPHTSYVDSKIEAAYVKQHLRELSQYTGIVRLTHRAVVTVPEG